MRYPLPLLTAILAGGLVAILPMTWASAQDSKVKTKLPAKTGVKAPKAAAEASANPGTEKDTPEHNLLDACGRG